MEKEYKATQQAIDSLKTGMDEVMGANVHGKSGNQLLGNGRPQFAANDTKAHLTGLDDKADSLFGKKPEDYKEPADSLFGKRPQDYEGKKGVTNSGGGYADFFRDQREKDETDGQHSNELEEVKNAVDVYNEIFKQLKELTGKEPDEIITNIVDLKTYAEIDEDSVWGKAANLLDEAYEQTGYTYYGSLYRYEALIEGIGVGHEEEVEELNTKMKDSDFVTPNSDNCYTYKSEYDEKYYFMPDDDATNILLSAYGYAPFGDDIVKLIVEAGTGNEYMDSSSLDTIDALGLLENSSETVLKTLGKAANYVGAVKTVYDIGDTIISNFSEINQLAQKIFGSTIASRTREGCIAKYNIYYNITKKALEGGVIDYDKTWYGDVDWQSIDINYEKMQKVMDSTGIDFDFVKEYYK